MTALAGRPNTALIVIDLQHDVVAQAYQRQEVLEHVNQVVARARQAQVPVIWVRHADEELQAGTPGWQIVAELVPEPGEAIIEKHYGDAFEATDLERVLAEGGIGRLVVTGAMTDMCIRSTLHGAFVRGYDTILVSDAHTTTDLTSWGTPPPDAVIRHTNLYWSHQKAPGREAGTATSADVDFAPLRG